MSSDNKTPAFSPDGTFICAIAWVVAIRDDCTTIEEKDELLSVLIRGAGGDYSTLPRNNKAAARTWLSVMKHNAAKRDDVIAKRSAAGKAGAKARKMKETPNAQSAENQDTPQQTLSNVTFAKHNVNVNVSENVNKIPPISPAKAVSMAARIGGGGNKFSFKDFAKAVAMAEKSVPEVITEEIGRSQVVWRVADYGGKYSNHIGALVYDGGAEGVELTNKIQNINVTYPPKSDFQALKLARELAAMDNPGAAEAIANEVDEHQDEPGIYQTMQDKVPAFRAGKVSNYRAFAQARKTV